MKDSSNPAYNPWAIDGFNNQVCNPLATAPLFLSIPATQKERSGKKGKGRLSLTPQLPPCPSFFSNYFQRPLFKVTHFPYGMFADGEKEKEVFTGCLFLEKKKKNLK